ncbi:hypothetical protein [Streptomyces sp. NPDC048551]|uniref:hypothetical protein n=1 Tax=Streptomyces sp. NPDC048551 TaxID=3155758 RepID=UPI0034195562
MLINGHEPHRARASADIVRNHGLRDPKDGEYVLDTYLLRGPRPPRRADAVSETARAVAAFAPDRAEEIAAGIADEPSRANALAGIGPAGIALVVAATGLDRALEIIAVIGDPALGQAALADVAPAVAAHDFERAVQLTEAVTGTLWKVFALTGIASVHLDTRHRRHGPARPAWQHSDGVWPARSSAFGCRDWLG